MNVGVHVPSESCTLTRNDEYFMRSVKHCENKEKKNFPARLFHFNRHISRGLPLSSNRLTLIDYVGINFKSILVSISSLAAFVSFRSQNISKFGVRSMQRTAAKL